MIFEVDVRGRGAGKTYDALSRAIKYAIRDATSNFNDNIAEVRKSGKELNVTHLSGVPKGKARVLYVAKYNAVVFDNDLELLKIVSDSCKEKDLVYAVEREASCIRIMNHQIEVVLHIEEFSSNIFNRLRSWQFNAMVQDREFKSSLLSLLSAGQAWGIYVGEEVPDTLFDWLRESKEEQGLRLSASLGV